MDIRASNSVENTRYLSLWPSSENLNPHNNPANMSIWVGQKQIVQRKCEPGASNINISCKYFRLYIHIIWIKKDCPWCYHFRKKDLKAGCHVPWLFLHVTRQRSVVGIDMKIDRFRLSKARQDGKMRLCLLKILDSFYIHGTIDQPKMLRLKAGRSCQGDQCPHLCGNHVHQQIHHS